MREAIRASEAHAFIAVAGEYCALLEGLDGITRAKLLQRLDGLLPLLYHTGASLPRVEPETEDNPNVEAWTEEARLIERALSALLGRWNLYQEIFDPAEKGEATPVTGSLASDLSEVYFDLRRSLSLSEARAVNESDMLWEWQCAFSSHWGRHVASALRVVNSLVHTQFADVLDESPSDA